MPAEHSGRLELARWLADPRHPLTARVYVNKVWGWHFGRPLVATTENFGVLGQVPTHPDLLDWLTCYFVESGWSTKALHRLILTSETYQMQSFNNDADPKLDPENQLLWRFPVRRLDAEEIRDSVLAVSGRLDQTIGGKSLTIRR